MMIAASSAHLTCLCGAVSAPGSLLSSPELPISMELCHCNSCRKITGSLGVSFPELSGPPPEGTLANLASYQSSSKLTRYFCSSCGCHCFAFDRRNEQWYCLSGIIEQARIEESNNADTPTWPDDIIKINRHDFVLDTIDGGLAPFLLDLTGRSIPAWSHTPNREAEQKDEYDLKHTNILSLPSKHFNTLPQPGEDSYFPAKCHCGGVSLLIRRASSTPILGTRHLPSNSKKYLTYFCACRSCRLSTGVPLTPWATVPPGNIFNGNLFSPPDGFDSTYSISLESLRPMVFGKQASSDLGSNPSLNLKYNWSSPDTCRSFCGNCGATISYWCAKRPEEVDLAVGIFNFEEGSLGRLWLDWSWGRCSFPEEAMDKEMYNAWAGSKSVMEIK